MTTQRDELAEIIQDSGEYIPGSHGEDYINPTKAADAAIADGWTKRRTITTPEERNLLTEGAVVRDDEGRVLELMWDDGGQYWNAIGDADFFNPPALPAIVLDEPNA